MSSSIARRAWSAPAPGLTRWVRFASVATAVFLVVSMQGCESQPESALTYTIVAEEFSFSGILMPVTTYTLDIDPSNVAFPDGTMVSQGQDLRNQTPEVQAVLAELQSKIDHVQAEQQRVTEAVEAIRTGGFSYSWLADSTTESPDVRSIGYQLNAALIDRARTVTNNELQHQKLEKEISSLEEELAAKKLCSDNATVKSLASDQPCADPSTISSFKQQIHDLTVSSQILSVDDKFARQASDNQLMSLFGTLLAVYDQLIVADREQVDRFHVLAPADGELSIEADKVYLYSTVYAFVCTATEEQVSTLTEATGLQLTVQGQLMADLLLESVTYSELRTMDPLAPKYDIVFSLSNPDDDLVLRPHGTAIMIYQSGNLVIPPSYLGVEGDGYYVIRDGQETPVHVSKDVSGQWVTTPGVLGVGDVIEEVLVGQ